MKTEIAENGSSSNSEDWNWNWIHIQILLEDYGLLYTGSSGASNICTTELADIDHLYKRKSNRFPLTFSGIIITECSHTEYLERWPLNRNSLKQQHRYHAFKSRLEVVYPAVSASCLTPMHSHYPQSALQYCDGICLGWVLLQKPLRNLTWSRTKQPNWLAAHKPL